MKTVIFRADASLQIGTGHVMRCLTLANKLKSKGIECQFVCRAHDGNLIDLIRDNGFVVHALRAGEKTSGNTHTDWLGATWQQDAAQTVFALQDREVAWLIVDHYALDERWEKRVRPHCTKLMVIDDLADRPHDCDLLLDQNLGRVPSDYAGLTADDCQLFIGPEYALLRPEFAEARANSLKRRTNPALKHLLIAMGGVDQNNATGATLEALKHSILPEGLRITVVMGPHAPWLADVKTLAREMPRPTEVKVGVKNMAQLMSQSDLAIGAAGSTSWERCCLGLPSIMVVLADNQISIAKALKKAGAAMLLENVGDLDFTLNLREIIANISENGHLLEKFIISASRVTDGNGSELVAVEILGDSHENNDTL